MQITDILPKYTQLNTIISEVSNRQSIEFSEQQFVANFYAQFDNLQSFEAMLIDLSMQTEMERCKTLTESISVEIQNNIRLISSNKSVLENLAIEKACEKFAKQYDTQVHDQLHNTQKYWKELSVSNSLDAIGFRQHTEQEEKRLWEKHKHYQRSTPEKATLNDLYEKCCTKNGRKISRKLSPKILSLSHKLNEITQKYISKTVLKSARRCVF